MFEIKVVKPDQIKSTEVLLIKDFLAWQLQKVTVVVHPPLLKDTKGRSDIAIYHNGLMVSKGFIGFILWFSMHGYVLS